MDVKDDSPFFLVSRNTQEGHVHWSRLKPGDRIIKGVEPTEDTIDQFDEVAALKVKLDAAYKRIGDLSEECTKYQSGLSRAASHVMDAVKIHAKNQGNAQPIHREWFDFGERVTKFVAEERKPIEALFEKMRKEWELTPEELEKLMR